jgi:acetyl esterase/lipase
MFLACAAAAGALLLSGCKSTVERVGMVFLYKRAAWPETQVRYDIPYAGGSASREQRLDLFLPQGRDWPVFIFVHGGGWTEGDKGLRVGGADVYGNIGRFFAAHGIGAAVIDYRLQPGVTWREQVDDVARATAWVQQNVNEWGGDARRIFIGGHSAGAQLAARVALDGRALGKYGLSPQILSGVILVSGAGLDLADKETYVLGASPAYYEQRFGVGAAAWQEASPATYARAGAPPFLLLYAGGETKALQRQSQRMSEVLSTNGIGNKLVVVPGQSHARIVLTLSREDKTAGPAMLEFMQARGKTGGGPGF